MTTLTASPEGTLDFTLIAGRHPVAGTAQRQEYHAGPDGVW